MKCLLVALAASWSQPPAEPIPPAPQDEMVGRWDMAYPSPSPDGSDIVFQGNFDGRWQLYAIGVDGRLRRLHRSDGDDTHPAFSPDGRRIAFISNRTGNDEVHILDLASGEARVIAPHPGKDGHPKWSVDGDWIVFNRTFDPGDRDGDHGSAIMRVRPDGSRLEIISDSPRVETFASLSPDGRSVALVEWFEDDAGVPNRVGDIVVVEIGTGRRRNLTRSAEFDGFPHWGGSGEWIYYSSRQSNSAAGEFQLFRISADGRRREALSSIDGVGEVRPVPSADERFLVFNRNVEGRTLIYRMPLPGSRGDRAGLSPTPSSKAR